jgi:hypothetical protein
MSLSKAISLGERLKFRFQAEALNLFNHQNWGTPGGFVTDSGIGTTGPMGFTNVTTNNNGGARVLELRANITF